MKEALSVIASAWALAFIVLFAVLLSRLGESISRTDDYNVLFVVVMFLAITGAGWLWYRSEIKHEDEEESENQDGR